MRGPDPKRGSGVADLNDVVLKEFLLTAYIDSCTLLSIAPTFPTFQILKNMIHHPKPELHLPLESPTHQTLDLQLQLPIPSTGCPGESRDREDPPRVGFRLGEDTVRRVGGPRRCKVGPLDLWIGLPPMGLPGRTAAPPRRTTTKPTTPTDRPYDWQSHGVGFRNLPGSATRMFGASGPDKYQNQPYREI